MALLQANLSAEPTVIEGLDRFEALDHLPGTDLVVAGQADGDLVVVDVRTGDIVTLDRVASARPLASFSPDGSMIAVVSAAEGVQLFETATGRKIGVPMVPAGQAAGARPGIEWAPDGKGVWITPSGGPVRFVADLEGWRTIACETAGRELTAEEWRMLISETEPQVAACS
jgi:hypothetical protein